MDKFIRSFMIRTIISILLLVIIAIVFGVIGCEVLSISGTKIQNNIADFTIDRSRLYIYSTYHNEFKDITKVQHRRDTAEDKSLVSAVYMINDSTKFSLFAKPSKDNEKLKIDLYNDLSFFIMDPKRSTYNKTFYKTNKFGWIGAGLFSIAIIWLINVPRIKKRLIEEKIEDDRKKRIDKLHEDRVHGLKNNKQSKI